MSVFTAGLQAAQELQLTPGASSIDTSTSSEAIQSIQAAADVVAVHQQLCAALQQKHALAEQQQSWQLSSAAALQSRQAALEAGSNMLSSILDNQNTIAERLRANKIRPCIPIQHDQQHHLSAVLLSSARGPAELKPGAEALQWANQLDCKPTVWEDTLAPVLTASKACSSHADVLQKFNDQLAQ